MTISLDTREQIIELRKEGYIYAAIARMVDVSDCSVKNICDEEKIPDPKKKLGRKHKYSEEQMKAVIDLRKEGYVYRAIAEMVDIPEGYVSWICKHAGLGGPGTLGRRMPGYRSEEERLMYTTRKKEIHDLRGQGLTLQAIADKYGLTRERVRQLCDGVENPDLRCRVDCAMCGKEFIPRENETARGGLRYTSYKYCSRECSKQGQSQQSRRPNSKWSRYGMVELVCTGCGVEFKRSHYVYSIAEHGRRTRSQEDSGRVFCSRECYQKNCSRKTAL